MFNQCPVSFTELDTINIDGKRHYILPNGKYLKSVTTILSEKLDSTALEEWKQRVGEEEASKVSIQSRRRGTAIHAMAERYLKNETDIYKKQMPVNIQQFKLIAKVLDDHVDDIFGIELPLYNETLGAAGRADLVARYNGVVSVIDFKTSKKLKKLEYIEGYILQSTIYSMMFEYMFNIPVPQIVIIITVDHERSAQTFVLDRSLYVNRVLEVFLN